MKVCTKCKVETPKSEMIAGGKGSWCKYCSKEYNLNIKEAYEKALNEFRKEYGISWQEIE